MAGAEPRLAEAGSLCLGLSESGIKSRGQRPVPGGSFLAKHQTSKHRREGQGKEPRSLGKGCLRMILFKH
jgi:hypothetical protein